VISPACLAGVARRPFAAARLEKRARRATVAAVLTQLVLTVIGLDRPGLVEVLSQTILAHEANWEESRMARLAGRFAGLLLVSVRPERAEALERDLRALESRGLNVMVERSAEERARAGYRRLSLDLVGNDRTGIIRDISRALAEHGVNVERLSTECAPAPMAGDRLFRMTALLQSPTAVQVDALRHELESLANDLMVDITLADTGEARR
jgi:glycine cleavage system regulatory protein